MARLNETGEDPIADVIAVDQQIEETEEAILSLMREISGIAFVRAGEEVEPEAYPAVTVSLSFFNQGDEQTGGLVEYGWRWILRLYVDYTAGDAYTIYKTMLVQIIRKFLANPSLRDTCYRHDLSDTGPPQPVPEAGLYIKTFEVVAEMEEG